MSRAERLSKQQERAKVEADEYLRQRQALAPKRMAVMVASCFPFVPWRAVSFSRGAYEMSMQAHARRFVSGVVTKREIA